MTVSVSIDYEKVISAQSPEQVSCGICSCVSGDVLPFPLQIVSAVVQEDQYEVSLTISFVSTRREGKQVSLNVSPGLCLTGNSGCKVFGIDLMFDFRWVLNVMLQIQQVKVLDQQVVLGELRL